MTLKDSEITAINIRLAELDAVPDFSPSMHEGHKMQVKGFLVRQPNAERISLTSVEMLAAECGKN